MKQKFRALALLFCFYLILVYHYTLIFNMETFELLITKTKQALEAEISSTAYNIWIESITPVSLEGDVATVDFLTEFQKNIFDEKYRERFCELLNGLCGSKLNLVTTAQKAIYVENDGESEERVPGVLDKLSVEQKAQFQKDMLRGYYEHTFETFIVGQSNSFAFSAAHAVANSVAQGRGSEYNPLFIYGPSGLGKTHLLYAIQNVIKRECPDKKLLYISGEQFTNNMVSSLRNGDMESFHKRFREVDVFLLDDVQFIAGKTATQEELFHTFNQLHALNKQIVLTSDRPPKDIKSLEERLLTRFEWGLIADIQPPEIETRVAIIKRKAELVGIELAPETIEYIAVNLTKNIRHLEGTVTKLKAQKMLTGKNPTIGVTRLVIKEILTEQKTVPLSIDNIIEQVASTFSVTGEDIRSLSRHKKISEARQAAIYIIREITTLPLKLIGEELGKRDHATILYSLKKAEERIKEDRVFKNVVEDLISNIKNSIG